jgi:hypothetical protein
MQALCVTGLSDVERRDLPNGQSILLVGPESTYTEALGMKTRVVSRYPDAIIIP